MKYGEKEVCIESGPKGYGYIIRFVTGGELPKAFDGLFTSKAEAKKAVDLAIPPEKKPAKQPVKQLEDES